MRELARDSRTYELMVIISPDVSDEDLGPATERVSGYISDAGGSIQEMLNDSPWGRRRLAYPIRHAGRDMRDGFYVVYHFSLAPDNVQEIEREIKLNDQIMRYLVVQYRQPVTPAPQPEAAAPESETVATDDAAPPVAAAIALETETAAPELATAEIPPATTIDEAPAAEAAPAAPVEETATAEAAANPDEDEPAATVPPVEPETAPEAAAGDEAGATTTADEQETLASAEEPAKED